MNERWKWIVAVGILSIIGYVSITEHVESRSRPSVDPFAEFGAAVREGLGDVELLPLSECQKKFQVRLSEIEKKRFLAAAQAADQGRIPGHSIRKLEARMVVTTSTARIEYEATVNKQRPEDLFLHRYIPVVQEDGSRRVWYYREIRIPGFGKWLSDVAPDAAL